MALIFLRIEEHYMRLRTFESFWLVSNGLLNSYPSLHENISTDIVVLGSGITGALMCYELITAGYDVVLLDKRDVAQGSTSATTAMLQYEIDMPLYKLKDIIGEEGAVKCYRAGIDAIIDLGEIISKNNIECGFETKKSLYVSHNKKASRWLHEEFKIRDKYKLGVQWLDSKEIESRYGIVSSGGILSDTAASADAYRLAHELISFCVGKGMQVYDHTEVTDIKCTEQGVKLTTEAKNVVAANKVIFCTGFESLKYIDEKIAEIITTYATISEQNMPLKKAWKETLVWNTDVPYLYARTTDDGRLLAGGEDGRYSTASLSFKTKNKKSERLKKKLKVLVPGIDFIEDFSWAGAFGRTKDALPYIGKYSKMPNAFFNLGFGGNGITFSVQGAKMIVKLLQGENPELLHYYRFGR